MTVPEISVTNINILLLLAAQEGNIDEVKRLISEGANVNTKDIRIRGHTPLHFTSQNGYKEIVNALLEAKA